MSYEEKGTWVYLLVNVAAFTTYVCVIIGRADGGRITAVPFVSTLLWTIGISIGASIIGRILFEIAKPSETHKSDVRDKEINRFGEYVGGLVLAVAMIGPFALALTKSDYFWIGNGMYAAFVLAALVAPTVKLVAYRRGM